MFFSKNKLNVKFSLGFHIGIVKNYSGKKRNVSNILIEVCLHGEAEGKITRSGLSRDCFGEHICLSLDGPELEVRGKLGKL